MPLRWRVNVLELLKENGYTSYKLRKDNIFCQSSIQNLRHDKMVSWRDLETICRLTGKQPGKLLEFVPEKQ